MLLSFHLHNPPPLAPAGKCLAAHILDGVDFQRGDLYIEGNGNVTASKEDCCASCAATQGCLYFTYNNATAACWLKDGHNMVQVANSVAVSGMMAGADGVPRELAG